VSFHIHAGLVHGFFSYEGLRLRQPEVANGYFFTARPDLLVIFTTGYTAELAALNHEIEEDAVCLQKPYSPQTLARAIRSTPDNAQTT